MLWLAKMAAFTTPSQLVAPKPRATSPDTASCLAWSRGHHLASAMSHCVERSKKGQGAEMAMSFTPSHVGQIIWHQLLLAGKVLHQQPRRQSGLPGLPRTSSHDSKQCPRPLSCRTEHRNRELAGALLVAVRAGVR